MTDEDVGGLDPGDLEKVVQLGDDGSAAARCRRGDGVATGPPVLVVVIIDPGRSYAQTRVKPATPSATGGGWLLATCQMSAALPKPDRSTTVGLPVPWHSR